MSLCFFIKDYQDLDHFVPIITTLKDSNKIFVVLENNDLENDKRFKYISNFVESSSIPQTNKFISYFKNFVFKYLFLSKSIFLLVEYLSKSKLTNLIFKGHFLKKNSIKAVIYDHRPPQNCKYIFLCKLFKIKILAFPHGYHIFTEKIEFLEKQTNRNIFDHYIVQTEFQKENLISLGLNENKLKAIGSLRFETKWIKILKEIYGSCKINFNNDRPILSIFLGHWKYGINKNDTLSLIKEILELNKFNIFINLHTRGTSKLEEREISDLKKYDKIIINNKDFHATQVIDISNIILGVGTSVLLECIPKNKPFYYLAFLQKYKTVFEELNKYQIPQSSFQIINTLKNLNLEKKNYIDDKSEFYFKFIKNNIISLEKEYETFFSDIIHNYE